MLYCEKCKKPIDLKPRTIQDRNRKNLPILCKHCIRTDVMSKIWINMNADDKNNRMKKVSEGRSRYFDNMTEKDKEIRSYNIKNGMANMTEEARINRSMKLSKINKEYWANISPEEYERQCEARRKGWENMDPKKREEWLNNIRKIAASPEQKKKISNALKKFYKEHPEVLRKMAINTMKQWETMTPDEKEMTSEKIKEYWKSVKGQKYLEHQLKIAKGIEKSKSKKYMNNKLENDLAKIFDENNIKYIHQYGTIEFYDTESEFYKLYSKYSKFIGYRKNWDFYLPDYDLYIDIDGPFHKYAATYENCKDEIIRYLSSKEVPNYSFIQKYYDTRRLLINKRIIIMGYNESKYKNTNESLELNESEVNMLISTLNIYKLRVSSVSNEYSE